MFEISGYPGAQYSLWFQWAPCSRGLGAQVGSLFWVPYHLYFPSVEYVIKSTVKLRYKHFDNAFISKISQGENPLTPHHQWKWQPKVMFKPQSRQNILRWKYWLYIDWLWAPSSPSGLPVLKVGSPGGLPVTPDLFRTLNRCSNYRRYTLLWWLYLSRAPS